MIVKIINVYVTFRNTVQFEVEFTSKLGFETHTLEYKCTDLYDTDIIPALQKGVRDRLYAESYFARFVDRTFDLEDIISTHTKAFAISSAE